MSKFKTPSKYIAILIFSLLAASGNSIAAEEWHCWKSPYDRTGPPLVKLRQSDDKSSGNVEVFGETHDAKVIIAGLTKRWGFGKNFIYTVGIAPDGSAAYYDFSHNDEAPPSMTFHCVLAQQLAEEKRKDEEKRRAEEAQKSKDAELKAKLLAEENARRFNSLQETYNLAIFQKIKRNWIRPVGSEKVPECWVRILQGSGGIVLDVTFGTCTGSTATYRASIENAVYKAEPLPKPGDSSLFERELNLNLSLE